MDFFNLKKRENLRTQRKQWTEFSGSMHAESARGAHTFFAMV